MDDKISLKEQLEILLEEKRRISTNDDDIVECIFKYFNEKTGYKYSIVDERKKDVKKWIKEFSVTEIIEAIDISFDTYYNGSQDSASIAYSKITGICHNRKRKDWQKQYWLNYLEKACENKYSNCNKDRLSALVYRYIETEDDFIMAKTIFFENDTFYWFERNLEDYFSRE